MREEILFILPVVNGICIIIHNEIWYNNTNSYTNNRYNYSYTCTNMSKYSYTCTNTIFSRPFQRYIIRYHY